MPIIDILTLLVFGGFLLLGLYKWFEPIIRSVRQRAEVQSATARRPTSFAESGGAFPARAAAGKTTTPVPEAVPEGRQIPRSRFAEFGESESAAAAAQTKAAEVRTRRTRRRQSGQARTVRQMLRDPRTARVAIEAAIVLERPRVLTGASRK